jgi:hypothetical protein
MKPPKDGSGIDGWGPSCTDSGDETTPPNKVKSETVVPLRPRNAIQVAAKSSRSKDAAKVEDHLVKTSEVIDQLQMLIDRIKGGARPTGIAMIVVEMSLDELTEQSYLLTSGLSRMEIIGNLTAIATEITMEHEE